MTYFKWIFGFMKPYRLMYGVGMFFYRLQSFAIGLIIGMVSMAVMTGILAGDGRQIVTWRLGLAALVLGLFAFLIQSRYIKPMAQIGREL